MNCVPYTIVSVVQNGKNSPHGHCCRQDTFPSYSHFPSPNFPARQQNVVAVHPSAPGFEMLCHVNEIRAVSLRAAPRLVEPVTVERDQMELRSCEVEQQVDP
jgi:hypothetical protein